MDVTGECARRRGRSVTADVVSRTTNVAKAAVPVVRRRRRWLLSVTAAVTAAAALLGAVLVPAVGACSVDGGQLKVSIDDVPEQLPVGSVVGTLRFDAPSTIRHLLITKPSQNFGFNVSTYQLVVTNVLDVDAGSPTASQQPQQMQIRCENQQGVPFEIDVWFYVTDINDNPPRFVPSDQYVFYVSEALPVSSEIGQVQATDADRDNLNTEYRILSSPHSAYFSLQTKPGGFAAIKVAQLLDFELYRQMSFRIIAMDCSNSGCQNDRRTSTATVIVNVHDADDQNPEFTGTPYSAVIFDNATSGQQVIRVHAVDLDTTLNATLRYDIVEDDVTKGVFMVDSASGIVTVGNPTLLQKDFLYLLQLKVCQIDDPSKRDSTTVVIRVQAARQRPPHFDRKLYEVFTVETTLTPMKLLTLVVRDALEEQLLQFSLEPSNDSAAFSIEQAGPRTGQLYAMQTLDFETQNRYEIVAKVRSSEQEDTTTIVIIVVDSNDNNPQFDAAVYEFVVNSSLCGTVHATDKDAATVLTYQIAGGRLAELFSISKDGILYLKGSQQEYTSETYILTVLAIDDGAPSRTGTTIVSLDLKPYLAIHHALPATQGTMDSYASYALGSVAAVLLLAVVILTVCLIRGASLKKQTGGNRSTVRLDDNSDDTETAMRPLGDCTYLAMSRVSAGHMMEDYSEAKDSGVSDDAISHCHHRLYNGHCHDAACDINAKAQHIDERIPISDAASFGHCCSDRTRRAYHEDSLLVLLPPPQMDNWGPTNLPAFDSTEASAALLRSTDGVMSPADCRMLQALQAGSCVGDGLEVGDAAAALAAAGGSSGRGSCEWHEAEAGSRGESTSSCGSRRSAAALLAAAHAYEERRVVHGRGGGGDSAPCLSSGGSPQLDRHKRKVVMRKSSLLARKNAAAQTQYHGSGGCGSSSSRCAVSASSRPNSTSSAVEGRKQLQQQQQQQQQQSLQSSVAHLQQSRRQLPAATAVDCSSSPSQSQSRAPQRKKRLVTNKDSLLYGDQADAPAGAEPSEPTFVRQCTLSPPPPASAVIKKKDGR